VNQLLSTLIGKHFFFSSATIKLITEIILALIHIRDVNLTSIALVICQGTQVDSGYKKLQRFFAKIKICEVSLAKLIVKLSGLEGTKFSLILDRTNWKFGQKHINILVLSVSYRSIGIPILWNMLDNCGGNSNSVQRVDLLDKFIKIFSVTAIDNLLADREFIGDKWLSFLAEEGVNFYIRIKSNLTVGRSGQELVTANAKIKKLKNNERLILQGKRYLGKNYLGPKVKVAAMRNHKGELCIIATNDNSDQAFEIYRQRWAIENLFGCLKTRGFNFENTHMVDLGKIDKLLAILAITFTICHITGIWRNEIKPIKIKKHGRKAMSLFRYGLDFLRKIFFHPLSFTKEISKISSVFRGALSANLNSIIIC
jgi:hypothetical protein